MASSHRGSDTMTDIVERLRAENKALIAMLKEPDQVGYWQRKHELVVADLERLRKVCKDQAGVELSEENDRLIDEIERLQAEKGALTAANEELIATLKELRASLESCHSYEASVALGDEQTR